MDFFYSISPSSGAALALSKYKPNIAMPSGAMLGVQLLL